MSSRDDPTELSSDSQDNNSEDSHTADSNFNETLHITAAGFSGQSSGRNDPKSDTVRHNVGNFEDSPSTNLTEENLNSKNPLTKELCDRICHESTNQQLLLNQQLNNIFLDESKNDTKTYLNGSFVNKYETFTNFSLPTHSCSNSEDSHSCDSISNETLHISAARFSGLSSRYNDPKSDTVLHTVGNFQDDPSTNLREGNFNFKSPLTKEFYDRIYHESTNQELLSNQQLNNVSSLDESKNDTKTSLNGSFINKYETFTNISLAAYSYIKDTETEVASDKHIFPNQEHSQSTNYNLEQELDQNSTNETNLPLMSNYDGMEVGNPLFNSIDFGRKSELQNINKSNTIKESSSPENGEGKKKFRAFQSNNSSLNESSDIDTIVDSKGSSVCSEERFFSDYSPNERFLAQINIAETHSLTHDESISESETHTLDRDDIEKIHKRDDNYEKIPLESSVESFPIEIQGTLQESYNNSTLIKQINDFFKTKDLLENSLYETETYQLKEVPKISSDFIVNEDTCVDGGLLNADDSAQETKKCYFENSYISEEANTLNNNCIKTNFVSNIEDKIVSEQSSFDETNLNSENESFDKIPDLEQSTCVTIGNISSENAATWSLSESENYCLNSPDMIENYFNVTNRPKLTANKTNIDSVKKVEVLRNSPVLRNDCNSKSNRNSCIGNHLCTEESIRHKYEKLKNIINRFFEIYEISSLHENQWKETLIEVAKVIGTSNLPFLSRKPNSKDKFESDNRTASNCKSQHSISNMNESSTTDISCTTIQSTSNLDLINKTDNYKIENPTETLKPCVNNPKAYDFDNKHKHQCMSSVSNTVNYKFENFTANETDLKFSLPKLYTPNNFAEEESKITNADENTQRKMYDLESKQSSDVKSSSMVNIISATQTFGSESNTQENYISSNDNFTTSLEKHIVDKNSIKHKTSLGDSKSRYTEAKNDENTDTNKANEGDSVSCKSVKRTPVCNKDDGNSFSMSTSSILTVPELNKGYKSQNKQICETCHHLKNVELEKHKSTGVSHSYEDISMKSRQLNVRQEDTYVKFAHVKEMSLNKTNNHEGSNNMGAEKQTSKRISSTDQPIYIQKDSKKMKSCKMKPKAVPTAYSPIIKEDIVSRLDLVAPTATAGSYKISKTVRSEKRTSNRTSPTDQSIPSQTVCKKLKSGKITPTPHCITPSMKKGIVSNLNFNAICTVTPNNNKESNNINIEKRTPKRTSPTNQLSSQSNSKKFKSCKIQPKSLNTTGRPLTKRNFVLTENPQKICTSSDARRPKEDCSSSSIFQMSQILQKFNYTSQEIPSSSNNEFVFGPRKFTNKGTSINPTLSVDNNCQVTLVAPTVFDRTMTAVKQLNKEGNGSTIYEIISSVRRNFPSGDKKLSQNIRRALKNATEVGFLTFADGKYRQTSALVDANISKQTDKRVTNSVANDKTLPRRGNLASTECRTSRPKTSRLTKNISERNRKHDSTKD